MNSEADPIVGNWYRHLDKGQPFAVVAVDDEAGLVEIQHFDGDLEEIELDAWYRLPIEPIEEPENWSGPLDVAELDDLGGTEVTDTQPEDWSEPLEEVLKQEELPSEGVFEEEEGLVTGEGSWEEEQLTEEPAAEVPEEAGEEEESPKEGGKAWSEDEP